MRLLDVIPSLDPASGGPAEGVRQFALAGRRLGHEREVLTLDAAGAPWLRDFPVPAHAIGPQRSNYGYNARLVPWLAAQAGRFDAIVVHGLWQYPGLATWRASRGTGTPYFVFTHGMLDPWFRRRYPLKHLKKWLYWPWAEYRVLRDAAAVLFTTYEEQRLAAQSFSLYKVRPATVGYGVDLDPAAANGTAQDFLALHPALRGQRLLLFMGRLHPKKGGDLLVEAFAAVAARDPRLHLVFAGPDQGGHRAELERLVAFHALGDRVTFTGMLQGRPKWGALHAAEAFVLPSHQENFGIAVAEALALGVPVLVTEAVNIWREVVEAGAGLAAPDTLAGTRDLLERWLAMAPADRSAMGERACACFARHFHVDAAAATLARTVQSHLQGDSSP